MKPLLIEIKKPSSEEAKYSLHLVKQYGNHYSSYCSADSKQEALTIIGNMIEKWRSYDSILGRTCKVTAENTEFHSFTNEITKAEIFGNSRLEVFL